MTPSGQLIDTEAARRCWREGLLFPGAINLALITLGILGPVVTPLIEPQLAAVGLRRGEPTVTYLLFFADIWLTLSIACAFLLERLEESGRLSRLVPPLLYLVGHGPLLCAVTVGGYVAELRGADRRWEKTDKVGRIGELVA